MSTLSSIKKSIHESRLYSNLLILNEYSSKVNRKNSMSSKRAALEVARKYKIVHANSILPEEKVKQIRKVLFTCKQENKSQNDFYYSIDEYVIPEHRGMVLSNFPVDYSVIVDHSLEEIRKECEDFNNDISDQDSKVINIIEDYIDLTIKHIKEAENQNFKRSIDSISGIRYRKAENLWDALQRILFLNSIVWQTGHSLMGLGRLDIILDRFECDENTDKDIKEFLEALHCCFNFKSSAMLGDTGQIIILGGINADGSYFNNQYTYKIINAVRELSIPDPKILLRVSSAMPNDLLECAVNCIATGVGSPLLSNDDIVIPDIERFGYTHEDACNYGVSACWEPLIIGDSFEQNNIGHIEFGKAMGECLRCPELINLHSFEEVQHLYLRFLKKNIEECISYLNTLSWELDPLLTLFTKSCLKKNKDISRGGAKYNNYGILSVGLSSAVDSLININKLCFAEKKYGIQQLVDAISNNYQNDEQFRQELSCQEDGFGTSSDEAISLTRMIMSYTEDCLKNYRNKLGGKVKFGLSSPNYINLGHTALSTADGRKNNTPFKTHISNDSDSPTDIVLFASKLSYQGQKSNGNVVDIMLTSTLMKNNILKFVSYLKSSIKLGFFQMQFNVVSYSQLVAAKKDPDKFPNLIVRVWGFSAYFKDLPEEYQDVLIARARESEKAA